MIYLIKWIIEADKWPQYELSPIILCYGEINIKIIRSFKSGPVRHALCTRSSVGDLTRPALVIFLRHFPNNIFKYIFVN